MGIVLGGKDGGFGNEETGDNIQPHLPKLRHNLMSLPDGFLPQLLTPRHRRLQTLSNKRLGDSGRDGR